MHVSTEAGRFACPDWWERIQAGQVPMPDVPVNEHTAAKALVFFERLRLPDVPGTPRLEDACGAWFKEIMVAFLASEDPETGKRLVWELLCMVPKKSSKSTYSAALALTALYLNRVPNGQMLLIGPSQNISNRLYKQARGMIELDEQLKALFKTTDNLMSIQHRTNGTELRVKTFDTGIVTGEIPIFTIIDELHVLGGKNNAAAVLQQIRGGGITKNRAQVMFITTQSDKRPAGVWKSEMEKARAIRDGKAGPRPIMLPVLYEFPEHLQKDEEYWRDKHNWPIVLPNFGLSIDEDALLDDYDSNGSASPEAERIWISQHLNIEIGIGFHEDRWIGADYWEDCSDPTMDLEHILETSDVVTLGIDPGGQKDLLALSAIGRHRDTGVWQHWAKLWAVKEVLQNQKGIASRLEDFRDQGDLRLVDDLEREAYAELVSICLRVRDLGLLAEREGIGIDRGGWAGNIAANALQAEGLKLGQDLTPVSQGYLLNNVSGTVAVKLAGKGFVHCGQPIMSWCVENCRMKVRDNAQYPSKGESGLGKIDGLMSLFDAAELMSGNPQAVGTGLDDFLSNPVMVV